MRLTFSPNLPKIREMRLFLTSLILASFLLVAVLPADAKATPAPKNFGQTVKKEVQLRNAQKKAEVKKKVETKKLEVKKKVEQKKSTKPLPKAAPKKK